MIDAPVIAVERLPADFDDWAGLLALVRRSFAYMDGIIDPPSSVHRLTVAALRQRASSEICLIAASDGRIVGCAFVAEREECCYLGKLAVEPEMQGKGIGRALVRGAETFARQLNKPALELQTRVELSGNHAAFQRLGFVERGRTAHPGFSRPTSVTMRKPL